MTGIDFGHLRPRPLMALPSMLSGENFTPEALGALLAAGFEKVGDSAVTKDFPPCSMRR